VSDEEYQEPARRGAPKGNQFWKVRTKHGRDKLFASADLLWESCCEYFQWVEDNPLWEAKAFSYQGDSWVEYLPKMQAMTISGLCIFLDIDMSTWGEWRKSKDFSLVVMRADEIIKQQKFTGAAADLLNANIIARDLGLADKKELTGANGDPLTMVTRQMTPQEAAEAYASTLNSES
jgi:hypothetical protein